MERNLRRRSTSQRPANHTARMYDNVDPGSMNNPFVDPDPDMYDLDTPDHFQEDPDLRSEWRNDPAAYDEDSNFMMPLNDVPSWWGTIPKMARRKAAACLKIATTLFPDGTDSFVEAQATDLMYLPNQVITATLKRIAIYDSEPSLVEDQLKVAEDNDGDGYPTLNIGEDKSLPADVDATSLEATLTEMTEAPAEVALDVADGVVNEVAPAEMAPELEVELEADEPAEEDSEMEPDADDDEGFDIDEEIARAIDDTSSAASPSTELGMEFSHDGEMNDMTDESSDELSNIFKNEHFDPTHLTKKASKQAKNLKLSEVMRNTVPRQSESHLGDLWGNDPSVSEAFGF